MPHLVSFHAPRRRLVSSLHTSISPSLIRPQQQQAHRSSHHPVRPSTSFSSAPAHSRAHPLKNPHRRTFTTSAPLSKKGKSNLPRDPRIRNIRYHLMHPLTPRPLRFSRNRHLRHWTIHRAWHMLRRKQSDARQLELQRQYMSMRNACEALRLIGEDGLAVLPGESEKSVRPAGARDPVAVTVRAQGKEEGEGEERETVVGEIDVAAAAERQKDVGKLYRVAMEKRGVFGGVPIEYARAQTDTPGRGGWDHEWKRSSKG
ncbi:MAG: hypothetical protein M1831_002630 [Alyxoria varia]|nr:MAG: hypothetical protein M1831_002630 [Alyxoria varia]